MKEEPKIYGLMAAFTTCDELLKAAVRAHAGGYRSMDGYSPFPIEGLADALGKKPKGVSFFFLLGGAVGCAMGFLLQFYSMAIDTPLNIGGKPLNSWPMFVPITFELTILGSAVFGFIATLALNGFPALYDPVFNVREFRQHASRDGFFLCIEASDPSFHPVATRKFLQTLNPYRIVEVHQ